MSASEEYPSDGVGGGEQAPSYLSSPAGGASSTSGTDLSPTKPQSANGHDSYDDGERGRDRDRDRDRDYRDEQQSADAASSPSSGRDRSAAAAAGSSLSSSSSSSGGLYSGSARGGYRVSARKLYVGNLPPGATQQEVMDLFARSPVPCALPSQVDMKLGYAFVVSNDSQTMRAPLC